MSKIFVTYSEGEIAMLNLHVGLIAGRHDMPVQSFILNEVEDVLDFDLIRHQVENWIDSHLTFSRHMGGAANQADYTDVSVWTSNERLFVYVTGLTSVTAELIRVCFNKGVQLTLMHYDRESGAYKPQVII